jgi:putative tricarboxylic transport membrane protein
MPFANVTYARAEVATAAAFVMIAAFAAWEGIGLGPGWGENGPEPGFFPFALATIMGLGGLALLVRHLVPALRASASSPFMEDRLEAVELTRVGLPILAAFAAVPLLGLYITAALYVWLFAWWHGRFRWYTSLAAGLVTSVVLFALLSQGFRIPMPQSIWYGTHLPF